MSKTLRLLVLALAAALMLAVGACGDEDDEGGGGGGGGGGGEQAESIKAALVTDIGGLNDRGFNEAANNGRKRAESELGLETRVLISKQNGDYVPNLTTLVRQQFDLIVSNGFLMGDATGTVAGKFPDTSFAIIDFSASALKGKPKNVEGLLFQEQEAGYLVGYLAALYAKDNDIDTISTVGGQKIPPVDRYIAGFQAGAKAANPQIETLNGYSQDFVDPAPCFEIALDQISRGSGVVFQVAGNCGLGALDAAEQEEVQGIGVDNDQSFLGDHILTSALKDVEEAVFESMKRAQEGTFKGGTDVIATVKNGGVGVGKIGPAGQKYADQLKKVQDQISSGEIKDIPDTVG